MRNNILIFKKGNIEPIPVGKPRNIGSPHLPSYQLQERRIGPQMKCLSQTLESNKAILNSDIIGIDPEMVLVFEIVGSVNEFIRACQKIGMEWLGDFDSIADADDDFYEVKNDGTPNKDKQLSEKLYCTMTNHTSLKQMLSLWEQYCRGDFTFPTGMAPFKDVFSRLRNIRRWGVQDRFEETNVIDIWNELLASRPENICFEIELWFRNSLKKRTESENVIREIIEKHGGKILKSSIYEEIAYHGLVAECPANEIKSMIDNNDHELINAEQIMWIRASGQVFSISTEENSETIELTDEELPSNPPCIALLDGLPLSNHKLLQDRIIINDPENHEEKYQTTQRSHGTIMASLIIHGDLNNKISALNSKLYVRPIMQPVSPDREGIPHNELFIDVLHKAIKEIGEDSELKKTIRIINLSIGNPNRPFIYTLSPEAKMLDWLSEKYNLLILVSSGNNAHRLDLDITEGDLKKLSSKNKNKLLYDYLWNEQQYMKIFSPSESINAITVGALHFDFSTPNNNPNTIDPISIGYPALYSCFGGGFSNSIKPDCVNIGGRNIYSIFGVDNMQAKLRVCNNSKQRGPGLKSASPYNGLTGTIFSCGTSNATALSSRICADLLLTLKSIPNLNIPSAYEATAIKTMFIHCCSWGELGADLSKNYVPQIARQQKKETLKWIGYGVPTPDISSFCTDQRVTLIGYGSISQNQQTELIFPLPNCLISKAIKKRLTITLSWMSPIAPNNKNYRLAKLKFDAPNKDLIIKDSIDADDHSCRRGTVQHKIYEGQQASTFQEGSNLKIIIQCKKEENLRKNVKYVIMATLEVAEETHLPIYQEVASRLQVQTPVEVK